MAVTHTKVSAKADGGDATQVLPSDWNADHTIADGTVTLAKMASIATDRLIGRDSASTGVPEALTVGGGVEFTGSTGIQRSALTGEVTATAGSNATTVAATHSGSTHAAATTTHEAAADPHTGYVLESLIDAAGDLVVGTADNTVGRLAKGTALQNLRTNAGATALEWADATSGAVISDTIWDAKGDLAVGTAADTAAKLSVGTGGQVLGGESTNGLYWQGNPWMAYLPTGALAENVPRYIAGGITHAAPTNSRATGYAIYLPRGISVASISFVSGTTALNTGTHFWVALYDSSLALLRQSTDDTSPVWGASAVKTTSLSSAFVTTYGGLYYAALFITASTRPTMIGVQAVDPPKQTLYPLAPNLSFQDSTAGYTATAPNPIVASTNASPMYCYVS